MSTNVVNVKVAHIRPKYQNLKEWMDDKNNCYIGRAGIVFVDKVRWPKESSKFANPFKVDKDGTRDEVIAKYEQYLLELLKKDTTLIDELKSMKGKNLGCWCKPEACHGDVLARIIDSL